MELIWEKKSFIVFVFRRVSIFILFAHSLFFFRFKSQTISIVISPNIVVLVSLSAGKSFPLKKTFLFKRLFLFLLLFVFLLWRRHLRLFTFWNCFWEGSRAIEKQMEKFRKDFLFSFLTDSKEKRLLKMDLSTQVSSDEAHGNLFLFCFCFIFFLISFHQIFFLARS